MDLKGNKITLGEILKNEEAKRLIKSELYEFYSSPMLAFAKKMSLEKILLYADGKIEKNKLDEILKKLENI